MSIHRAAVHCDNCWMSHLEIEKLKEFDSRSAEWTQYVFAGSERSDAYLAAFLANRQYHSLEREIQGHQDEAIAALDHELDMCYRVASRNHSMSSSPQYLGESLNSDLLVALKDCCATCKYEEPRIKMVLQELLKHEKGRGEGSSSKRLRDYSKCLATPKQGGVLPSYVIMIASFLDLELPEERGVVGRGFWDSSDDEILD